MSIFKCKMCGGALEIQPNATVAECEYCGTMQTLPKLDDGRKANLYDRANHFRRNNEFDKAAGIYEQILNDDGTDAETYWSLVLCRYGIEYVEDPATHKRVPTVNRAQFTSIFDDDNYKSALQYADLSQRAIYEDEAKAINEIQKGILAISQKEEPFDVFICYKESDANGRRTPDSVLATDLYHQLTQEGFKVFFSRITLEDKLGTAYEPYIFAALNSAKVMVVLGTRPEYFNAVWVKNEWSRYLALIKQGQKKLLIPAYKDMDPYDLPEEFSHLQAQDMSKLGFMQDLIRGVKKILTEDAPKAAVKETVVVSTGSANVEPLLKRAFMFLEDGDWKSANEYCEKVLDQDPENAQAYLGKLMAELWVRKQADLRNYKEPFDGRSTYQKIARFGDEQLRKELEECNNHIRYTSAQDDKETAETEDDYKNAASAFAEIPGYRDADAQKQECLQLAEEARKDAIYTEADKLAASMYNRIEKLEKAVDLFLAIPGWRDADARIEACQRTIEELKAEQEAERLEQERKAELARQEAEKRAKLIKKIAAIAAAAVVACIAVVLLVTKVIIPNGKYKDAVALMEAGQYTEAIAAFEAMDGYKDSNAMIMECKYGDAVVLMEADKYNEAYNIFCELGDYKDAADKADDVRLEKNKEQLKNIKTGSYIKFGVYEQDDNTSNGKEDIDWFVLEINDGKALIVSQYALDCKPYNSSRKDTTWETCYLRKWLNNDFANTAFSTNEKAMIPTVTVSADKNPKYSTNPGNATQDQIFLLSITEANEYFSSDIARRCKPTDYAVANGAHVDSLYSPGNCWWWLRSPGLDQTCAVEVVSTGIVHSGGKDIDYNSLAVRPALWINLNA